MDKIIVNWYTNSRVNREGRRVGASRDIKLEVSIDRLSDTAVHCGLNENVAL